MLYHYLKKSIATPTIRDLTTPDGNDPAALWICGNHPLFGPALVLQSLKQASVLDVVHCLILGIAFAVHRAASLTEGCPELFLACINVSLVGWKG